MSAVRDHISGKFSETLNVQSMEAKANGQKLKALAVINPGNPTGQCLPYANMVEVIKFCEREDIVLMADEVRFQSGEGSNEASSTVRIRIQRAHLLHHVLAFLLPKP
jgi:bifunctional pyridoxal-dependent enzyme with beta-cystathionase and maltose regulon repressor activities